MEILDNATLWVGARESGAECPYAPASATSVSAAPSIPLRRLYPCSQPHAVCPFKIRKWQRGACVQAEVEMRAFKRGPRGFRNAIIRRLKPSASLLVLGGISAPEQQELANLKITFFSPSQIRRG